MNITESKLFGYIRYWHSRIFNQYFGFIKPSFQHIFIRCQSIRSLEFTDNLNIFDEEISKTEIAFYKTKINKYGLPLDCRSDYTKATGRCGLLFYVMKKNIQILFSNVKYACRCARAFTLYGLVFYKYGYTKRIPEPNRSGWSFY